MPDARAADIARTWTTRFAEALDNSSDSQLDLLLADPCYWRDVLALTWDTCQFYGPSSVKSAILAASSQRPPREFRLDPDRPAPQTNVESGQIEFFLRFETEIGHCRAFVVGFLDDEGISGMRAKLVSTDMVELDVPTARQGGDVAARGYEPAHPGETWSEARRRVSQFEDVDPQVLVVGGGQWGVAIAGELGLLDVTTLVIDKHDRPGDSWRERYSSLALHTPLIRNNLPRLRFPEHFPTFLSKDQWADWIDGYASATQLNWWGGTELVSARYDDQAQEWTARLRLSDGTERVMNPQHVVLAAGIGGGPRRPDLPGLSTFAGEVLHSTEFTGGAAHAGKNALVIGVSTTGHDIALDLYHHGATTTLAQRGPATIVDIDVAQNAFAATNQVPLDEADQRSLANLTHPVIKEFLRGYTERTNALMADKHAALRRAGMRLDDKNPYGWLYKTYNELAGYYLNVGCSEVIIDGGIAIQQTSEMDCFVPEGMQLRDGRVLPFDVVVLATGFEGLETVVENLFGADTAARVGRIVGFGEDGETRNLCRVTGQERLWIGYGGIIDARKYSPIVAMQIRAQLSGLAPTFVRGTDNALKPVS